MDWRDRIRVDPDVCHGKVCVKGTRVVVSVILDDPADGESITSDHHVEPVYLLEALYHAADLAQDRVVAPPQGAEPAPTRQSWPTPRIEPTSNAGCAFTMKIAGGT